MPDVLDLLVFGQAVFAEFTADAGLLHAAPLGLRDIGVEVVDPDSAVAQAAGDSFGAAGVFGPHSTGEAVDGVIAQCHCGVFGSLRGLAGEGFDRQHGAEGLVVDAAHRLVAAVEDGRQVVGALRQFAFAALAAGAQNSAAFDGLFHVAVHLVQVVFADERAGLGVFVKRTAQADEFGAADEFVDDLIVNRLFDDQTSTGRAHLAGVQEDRGECVVDCRFEISVGKDDVGVLPTQFQGDLLHGRSGSGHDDAAGFETTSERHEVHLRVFRHFGTHGATRTGDEVCDTGRKPRLVKGIHEPHGGLGSQLGRLEHEGVSSGDGRSDLPGCLQQREVPRGDERAHAHRFGDDAAGDGRVARVNHAARVLVSQACEVAEDVDDVVHVLLGLDEALARVLGFHAGDLVFVALADVGQTVDNGAAFGCRGS